MEGERMKIQEKSNNHWSDLRKYRAMAGLFIGEDTT